MCIIVVKPADKEVSNEIFRTCFENNPDGCGYMYALNGKVYGKKGLMTYKDFLEANKKIPKNVPVVYHFRIQTSGGVIPELTHPYPASEEVPTLRKTDWVSKDYGIAHNGVFEYSAPKDESDTTVWIRKALCQIIRLSKLEGTSLFNEKYNYIMDKLVEGCRVAVMDKKGKVVMYGTGWKEDNGVYYSNTSYQPKTYTLPTNYNFNWKADYTNYDDWYSTNKLTNNEDSAYDVELVVLNYNKKLSRNEYVNAKGEVFVYDIQAKKYVKDKTLSKKGLFKANKNLAFKLWIKKE